MARIEESNPEDERRDESKPDLEESVTSRRKGRETTRNNESIQKPGMVRDNTEDHNQENTPPMDAVGTRRSQGERTNGTGILTREEPDDLQTSEERRNTGRQPNTEDSEPNGTP